MRDLIIIIILCLVAGFLMGFLVGEYYTMKWVITFANNFVEFEFDVEEIARAMSQYKNAIDYNYGI